MADRRHGRRARELRRLPLDLSILVAHERLVLSEIRLGAGADGPSAHIHNEHFDGFYVVDGEASVLLGSEWHALPAGAAVVIPPRVVHTFRNDSSAAVVTLNLHVPGAGFDDYVRAGREGDDEARARFDQAPPPEDGGRPGSDAILVRDRPVQIETPTLSLREREGEPGAAEEDGAVARYALGEGRFVELIAR